MEISDQWSAEVLTKMSDGGNVKRLEFDSKLDEIRVVFFDKLQPVMHISTCVENDADGDATSELYIYFDADTQQQPGA